MVVLDTASAIIGVISFSLEFIKILRAVHATGSSKKWISLEDSSEYLQRVISKLQKSLPAKPHAGLSDPDEDERGLAEACIKTAEELKKQLDSCRRKSSFVTAVKLLCNTGKLEEMQKSLEGYEKTLQTTILAGVR